jgi:hypothetical protein
VSFKKRKENAMADMKDVFTIVKNGEKEYWNGVGKAFVNRDGSLTVRLNALPVNGQLMIRDPRPKASDVA